MEIYVLYNPYANNGEGRQIAKVLDVMLGAKYLNYVDITKIANYHTFFAGLTNNEKIIICGGDGTLNHFINDTKDIIIKNDVYYYPSGNGNDFFRDLNINEHSMPIKINKYLEQLPRVTVKGKTYKFINGIGYGIDGYCCEEGDKLRKNQTKKINYTKIAIKGLLFHYKPTKAEVMVDGEESRYSKVWLAPTMKGRYYGGGMMPTPNQQRNSEEVSIMIFHGCNKLKTLLIFSTIFKGQHIKYSKYVTILTGKNISVKFDRPTPLQIDGETFTNVLEYQVESSR